MPQQTTTKLANVILRLSDRGSRLVDGNLSCAIQWEVRPATWRDKLQTKVEIGV